MKTIENAIDELSVSGRIPVTLGISGHRHLWEADVAKIRSQLHLIFETVKTNYPNSPLLLISPLAEGADQLIAEVALQFGIPIYAVLPMSQEEYVKDFKEPKVLQKFHNLLAQASYCASLEEFDPDSQRELAYASVGKWVVDQSDILIAIWDGQLDAKTGGTGEVVNYALSGDYPCLEKNINHEQWISANSKVIHIQAGNNQEIDAENLQAPRLYQKLDDLNDKGLQTIEESIKNLNVLQAMDNINHEISENTGDGYPLLHENIDNLPGHLQFIHGLYFNADQVANRFQKTFKRYTFGFYFLTAAMLTTLLLYFRVFPFNLVIGLYMLIYIVTIVVSARIKNSDFQKKYHLFRTLAEVSRLFFFFKLSEQGRDKRPSIMENHRELQYLTRKIGNENSWLIDAFRKIGLFESANQPVQAIKNPMQLVKTHWIDDQNAYFKKALLRDQAKLKTLGKVGAFFFFISFLCGAGILSLNYVDYELPALMKPLLSAGIGISLGLGGILKTYSYTMGYSELAGQYQLMSELFDNAEDKFNNQHSNNDAVFEQLWWEALMENIEWFSLKNSRLLQTKDFKEFFKSSIRLIKS